MSSQNRSILDKIISIIIACLLWIYVMGVENPIKSVVLSDIPVRLLNEETLTSNRLAIVGGRDYKVNIVIEGSRADMINLAAADIIASADLLGFGTGQNDIAVNVKVPGKYAVKEVRPSKIGINIEELVTASVPVEISPVEIPADHEIGAVSFSPATVDVSGPKSNVAQVVKVVAMVDGKTLGTVPSQSKILLSPIDEGGEKVPGVRLSSEHAEVTACLYSTKEVLLDIPFEGEPAAGMHIKDVLAPDTIVLKGDAAILKLIEAVVAEPINIEGIFEDTEYPVVMVLPPGVELSVVSGEPVVRFIMSDVSEISYTYGSGDIFIYNLGEELESVVEAPTITVTARGEEAVISILRSQDLQPAINLADLVEGVYELPLKIRYEQQLVTVDIKPQNVKVYIIAQEPAPSTEGETPAAER